ncbi:MAG: hypothetical protein ABUL65_02290, partial [Opitutus sp.]
EKGAWTVNLGHTFYSGMTDATWDPSFLPDYQQDIPAYNSFDTSVSYVWTKGWKKIDSVKVSVGVNNIGDKMPTKSATYDSFSNADITEFSPIGRLYFVTMAVKC